MGGAQSSESGQHGFHVLKVKENSPAFHAGIEQFFDYIVGIDGISLDNGDSQALVNALQVSEGKPIPVAVYSSKDQAVRELMLTPGRDWHKNDPNEKSLIGCSIRFCSYERAGENVWHVLDVAANSPAEMAGIIPHTDYIIGSPHMALRSEDDFYNLVEEFLGKPLRLYVYNTEWDSCREAIIVPNHDWGGAGSLGCDVGYGLLHRIPRRRLELAATDEPKEGTAEYSGSIFSTPDFGEQLALDLAPQPESTRVSLDKNIQPSSSDSKGKTQSILQEACNTELPASPHQNKETTEIPRNDELQEAEQ
ncbi:Golgi reassembly-stacking protein 2 [Apophysomyces sp. BC1034]|nr:Golgi reassembly-stacking protein 2 [Apophysomyces sp. BC1015]KAG0182863.1 Golgi reassembly-stacking protein 2 [Apophysomyces sp. BC1021]KAG0193592.1 Golgi reassembly-stacking protein 2 [Apophysomyces sp. BC1034]